MFGALPRSTEADFVPRRSESAYWVVQAGLSWSATGQKCSTVSGVPLSDLSRAVLVELTLAFSSPNTRTDLMSAHGEGRDAPISDFFDLDTWSYETKVPMAEWKGESLSWRRGESS